MRGRGGGGGGGILSGNSPRVTRNLGARGLLKTDLSRRRSAELRSCVKVEVVVLGALSLIVRMVSVDVKPHLKKKKSSAAV